LKALEIIKETKRLEEDVLFSEQQHLIAAKWWMRCHYLLGLVASAAGVLATGAAASSEKGDSPAGYAWIAPSIVTVLAAVIAFLRPDAKSDLHHDKGARYNDLRRRLRIFENIEFPIDEPSMSPEQALKRLNSFEEEKTHLNRQKPTAPSGLIYLLARRQIEQGNLVHAIDDKSH
jgi:hypothetical protein